MLNFRMALPKRISVRNYRAYFFLCWHIHRRWIGPFYTSLAADEVQWFSSDPRAPRSTTRHVQSCTHHGLQLSDIYPIGRKKECRSKSISSQTFNLGYHSDDFLRGYCLMAGDKVVKCSFERIDRFSPCNLGHHVRFSIRRVGFHRGWSVHWNTLCILTRNCGHTVVLRRVNLSWRLRIRGRCQIRPGSAVGGWRRRQFPSEYRVRLNLDVFCDKCRHVYPFTMPDGWSHNC